jgi:hypothetical protein
VTLFLAASGRAAPSAVSAVMRSVPPSMRQPPSLDVAVLVFDVLPRISVPAPILVIVALPAIVELIVAIIPASTL